MHGVCKLPGDLVPPEFSVLVFRAGDDFAKELILFARPRSLGDSEPTLLIEETPGLLNA